MGRQGRGSLEALSTLFTGENLLLSMYSSMLAQTNCMTKCLGTDVTGIRTITTVGSANMHLQTVRSAEWFVALGTSKSSLFLCFQ